MEHYKNTIFRTILSLGLVIFLYSFTISDIKAKKIDSLCEDKLQNLSTEAIYREDSQLLVSQGNTIFLNCLPLRLANNLSESENFKFNRIKKIEDEFYFANSQGLMQNYNYIFEKFEVLNFTDVNNALFLATDHGVFYSEINDYDEFFNIPEMNFRTFEVLESPWRKNEIYILTERGVFLYKLKTRKLKRINQNLLLGADSLINFGRLQELDIAGDKYVFLVVDRGIFFLGKKSKKWQMVNLDGIQVNTEADYEFLEIESFDDYLFVFLKTGVFYLNANNGFETISSWKELALNLPKASDYTAGLSAVHVEKLKDKLNFIVANFQGELFEFLFTKEDFQSKQEQPLSKDSSSDKELNSVAELKLMLELEPSIRELHEEALKFAAIPTGEKLRAYRLKARLRNFLPELDTYFDNSDYSLNGFTIEGRDQFDSKDSAITTVYEENLDELEDNEFEFGFRFRWNFGNLLYDPELMDIVNSSRIIANVRENLLAELNQIYFQRKELILSLLESVFKRNLENYLELERLTANIDARTGAWFSKEFKKRKGKYLRRKNEKR